MKKYSLITLSIALMLACCMLLVACGNKGGTTPEPEVETKILRVGMECAYAPFNWTQVDDSNGAVALGDGTYAGGYDVEIAKRVAEIMGMELQIVKTEWDGLPPSLTSGKIDAIIAGMTNTAERRETIDFTDDYYTSDLVIVVLKDGPYANATNIQEFSGAKVTGQLATLHYDVIDQIVGVDKQQAMKDFPTMVVALSSGKIDGYVSERPGAISAAASNPGLTFVGFEGDNGFDYSTGDVSIAIGIRQNEADFKASLNAALNQITAEERAQYMESAVKNQPLSEE
ncbi:transporter substrate-binding domain-containing protein [Eubacteriales bacterium OttesenSCG-928-K08]|nr:transporter substrate-binding domain-containing protein [Eubacteriales bacterium OttesenSCG-928-K08]